MFGNSLCFKSEYLADDGKIEAYNEAGEFFWGGTTDAAERSKIVVQPVRIEIVEADDL
jgi:hypothetical protein